MVRVSQNSTYLSAKVGFKETVEGTRRIISAIYPVADDFQEGSDSLCFYEAKRNLPAYGDAETQEFIVKPVFDYWWRLLGGMEVRLSVSVPIDYSFETCQALQEAAKQAGFPANLAVNELLASLSAYVPSWYQDNVRWKNLESGRCIWVVDCGYADLNLGLVHAEQRNNRLDFLFLAGDCLEDFGACWPDSDPEAVAVEIRKSVPNLIHAAFDKPWPGWQGQRPEARLADWIICAGGGPNLRPACEAMKACLGSILGHQATVFESIPPAHVVAMGAAVCCAIHWGQLPYQIGTVHRRVVLGLRLKSQESKSFIPITNADREPPLSFERAFRLPVPPTRPVEITLAAALPGGDRLVGLQTFVLGVEVLKSFISPIFFVQGELANWKQGRFQIIEAGSGKRLRESNFQLP